MARTDTGMYGQHTGPMTDRAEYEDVLGGQDIHPQHAPGELPADVIQHWLDMLQGRGDQYVPDSPGGIMSPGSNDPSGPGDYGPQEWIRQRLAGDVVPMRAPWTQGAQSTLNRFGQTDAPFNSSGQQSIQSLGGPKSPYLDLLNILAYPQGGQIRK